MHFIYFYYYMTSILILFHIVLVCIVLLKELSLRLPCPVHATVRYLFENNRQKGNATDMP